VNAMLLNEFLKEHRKVQSLEKALAQQEKNFASAIAQQHSEFKSAITHQQDEIQTLTTRLQRVSEQLEPLRAPARVVVNNQ